MILRSFIQSEPDKALSLLRISFPRQMQSELTIEEKAEIAYHHILTAEEISLSLSPGTRNSLIGSTLKDFFGVMPKGKEFATVKCEIHRVAQGCSVDLDLR